MNAKTEVFSSEQISRILPIPFACVRKEMPPLQCLYAWLQKRRFCRFCFKRRYQEPISPCGACRQVISELYPSNAPIYMTNMKGMVRETNVIELLPFAFSPEDLK